MEKLHRNNESRTERIIHKANMDLMGRVHDLLARQSERRADRAIVATEARIEREHGGLDEPLGQATDAMLDAERWDGLS